MKRNGLWASFIDSDGDDVWCNLSYAIVVRPRPLDQKTREAIITFVGGDSIAVKVTTGEVMSVLEKVAAMEE